MNDLPTRMRDLALHGIRSPATMREAADEIERLREAIRESVPLLLALELSYGDDDWQAETVSKVLKKLHALVYAGTVKDAP